MSDYRRAFAPGGCYFFTVVTHGRQRLFEDIEHVDRLREGMRRTLQKRPFAIDAIVILPDHLHTIWRLPENDEDFSLRWRLIKHFLACSIEADTNGRGEKLVWQRRFWEHQIRNQEDWRRHLDYIHFNPVKHGYVSRPGEWPWGSFAKAVKRGWYPADWGEQEPRHLVGMDFE